MKRLLSLAALLITACGGTTSDGSARAPSAAAQPSVAETAPSLPPSHEPPSPSVGGVGIRISLPVGFALRLPDDWMLNQELDPVQAMSGVILAATGPGDQALTVVAVPYADPRPFGDAIADQVSASGATVSALAKVDLPAGTATRIVFSTTEGKLALVAIGDGQFISDCHSRPAGYVVTVGSAAGEPPDEQTLDVVARSIELEKKAAECGPTEGDAWSTPLIAWSSGGRLGKYGDDLFALMAMPGGEFLGLGTTCPQENPVGGRCPVARQTVAWVGGTDGEWQQNGFPTASEAVDMVAEPILDGIVAVQTSATGGAIVWFSRDGRDWAQRSVIGGEPGCLDWHGSPFVTDLNAAGSSVYVTGDRCVDGTSVPTIYRSEDLRVWSIVGRLPADATAETVGANLPEYAAAPVTVGDWSVAFDGDAGAGKSWAWLSPDGARWREISLPADVGYVDAIAGWDGSVMFVASADGFEGFEAWLGVIE